MSRALDLYLSVGTAILNRDGGNEQAFHALCDAAAEWRREGIHLSAAYAMEVATAAGWGVSGLVDQSVAACVDDCRRCVEVEPLDSVAALAAIQLWRSQLRYADATARRELAETLQRELLERVMAVFSDGPDSVGYLIRGVQLVGHLDGGNWTAIIPDAVQRIGRAGRDGHGGVLLSLPSAFSMLRGFREYEAMQMLIDRFPDEFESVVIKGWRVAVAAELAGDDRAAMFQRAADAFAEDREPTPEEMNRIDGWSGENLHAWSKYYRARAALAGLPDQAANATKLVEEAVAALEGTESGLVIDEVYRLGLVVRAVAALVGTHEATVLASSMKSLETAIWLFGEHASDEASRAFIEGATEMMKAFESDPASAIASSLLASTLDRLALIPSIGSEIAHAVRPAVGQHALDIVRGLDQTWVHRVLAGIRDERQLQRVFCRVAQGGLPHYAQIRHGPLEYGKDVVVLGNDSGRNVLRMYQMKCGDIDLPGWRMVKNQLEEMFTVPLASMNINEPVDERIGVLVCNGHALPTADPPMVGWFEQELRHRCHRYEFMQLETLANWIVGDKLYGAFRTGLREAGISI